MITYEKVFTCPFMSGHYVLENIEQISYLIPTRLMNFPHTMNQWIAHHWVEKVLQIS